MCDLEDIKNILSSKKIKLNGCFHVGAHDCEEIDLYNNLGIKNEDIICECIRGGMHNTHTQK